MSDTTTFVAFASDFKKQKPRSYWISFTIAIAIGLPLIITLACITLSLPFSDSKGILSAYGSVATAAIFLVSIGTALAGTVYAYQKMQQTEYKRATMEIISRQVHDNDLVTMFDNIRSIQERNQSVSFFDLHGEYLEYRRLHHHHNAGEIPKKLDYDIAIQVLNYYESIALGISFRAIDQEMYMRWWKNSFTEDWVFLYEFVLGHRCQFNAPRSFIEYETLVTDLLSQEQEEKLKQAKARFSRHKDTPAKKKTPPATAHAATTALLLRAKPAKSYLQH